MIYLFFALIFYLVFFLAPGKWNCRKSRLLFWSTHLYFFNHLITKKIFNKSEFLMQGSQIYIVVDGISLKNFNANTFFRFLNFLNFFHNAQLLLGVRNVSFWHKFKSVQKLLKSFYSYQKNGSPRSLRINPKKWPVSPTSNNILYFFSRYHRKVLRKIVSKKKLRNF